jgi:hypothetical protein
MDRAKDAEIEGGADERAEERRVEMREGIMEEDFGSCFILLRVLGHGNALCSDMFTGSRSNSTVRSAS